MATAYALFSLPSSVDSATVFTFVQDHLAAGFTNSGGGSGDGPEDIVFEGVPTDAFEAPQLMVTTEQAGTLMGVRVDAQVVWLPVRTAAERVPTSVTGAELAYAGGAAPTTIAIGPTDARRLASIVNALPTLSDAKHNCPAHTSGITLTFDTKPSTVVEVGICGGEAAVAVGGVEQPSLADSGALEGAVDALLGLPVNRPAK